jgi:hypothetical protein
MGSGAAKHRGKRQLQKKKATGSASPWVSQKRSSSALYGAYGLGSDAKGRRLLFANPSTLVPDLDPALRSQALQGWQSFADHTHTSTLIQEARNTERHGFAWGNSARLRDNKIQFVSAGNLGMNKSDSEGNDVDADDLEEHGPPEALNKTRQTDVNEAVPEHPRSSQDLSNIEFDYNHSAMTERVGRMEIVAEAIDSGPATLADDMPQSTSRPRSTSESSFASEEEVIVFGGRRGESRKPVRQPGASPQTAAATVTKTKTIEIDKNNINALLDNDPASSTTRSVFGQTPAACSSFETLPSAKKTLESNTNFGRRRGRRRRPSRSENNEETQSAMAASSSKNLASPTEAFLEPNPNFGTRRGRRSGPSQREIEEDALIRDYIANMKDDGTDKEEDEISVRNEHFRFDGPGEADVKVQTRWSGKEKLSGMLDEDLEWSSGDLEDFDDMSTTDDEIAEVGRVYAERMRPSGFQYLVTAVGKGPSDACWVLGDKLISTTATKQIQIFEERRETKLDLLNDALNNSTTDSDEDEVLDDLRDTIESEEDENARLIERTARMTDAQIAEALDMQDKLGMPTNEVLLFNGQEDNEFANGDDFIPFSSKQHVFNRTKSKRNLRKKDGFPSAEAFADALDQDPYNGFDVMDFDRPSLKPKRKGRKSTGLTFELEDEKLALELQQSWDNDRSKKAVRKRQREEMRQAGLLGSKAANGRVDLHTRYKESGMDAEQIRTEIRSFLVQEIDAVALAPMAADMRASVHRLARALNLKSHSQGKADGRFPILTKTPQSRHYTMNNIWEIDALLNQRKFFPRAAGSFKTAKQPRAGPKARGGGGCGVLAGVSYMDGEVVGASAPEIGADNRGRAMLEKMGWSSGMGIGKVGNKGSTEVIKHVVKNTKAGLG